MASSLFLLVSAAVGLAGAREGGGSDEALRARGWQATDHVDCEGLEPRSFYELSNEDGSVELLARDGGGYLVSRLPLPEAPYECRKVPGPQFVEEIR